MRKERLAILVPDGAYPEVLRALLGERCESLGIRIVGFEVVKDALRDSSPDSAQLLRSYLGQCTHALVLRDLHGSGAEAAGAKALELRIEAELHANGWPKTNAAAIVVEPEIEAWLRFDSTHMAALVKGRARRSREKADLLFPLSREKAINQSGGASASGKPINPKEAFEAILREFGIQRSNALYGILAGKESLKNCIVPSFQRLTELLRKWFPKED